MIDSRRAEVMVVRRLSVSRATVCDWAQHLAAGGLRALRRRQPTGPPARLTRDQPWGLRRGALAAGLAPDRWTMGRVRPWIEREFGVRYHRHSINRSLARLGWSLQQPLPRGREQDEALSRAWLDQDWPRIKKARRLGVNIVCFDEFGDSCLERLWRTWAPRGQRPVVRRVTRARRALTTPVGLTQAV